MNEALYEVGKRASAHFQAEGMESLQAKCYGCCRCQSCHYEGEPQFEAHLVWQSKHGWYYVPLFVAIANMRPASRIVQIESPEV